MGAMHSQLAHPHTGIADHFRPEEIITAVPRVEFLTSGDYLVLSVSVTYSGTGQQEKTNRLYASQLCSGLAFSCDQLRSHVARKLFRDLQEFAIRGMRVVTRAGEPFTVQDLTALIDV